MTRLAVPLLGHWRGPWIVPAGVDVDRCPVRLAWLTVVEAWTQAHRESRRRDYVRKGYRALDGSEIHQTLARVAAELGLDDEEQDHEEAAAELRGKARWHFARAKGQTLRFDRVRGCRDTWTIVASCARCGVSGDRQLLGCSHDRLCVHCRGRRVAKLRARLLEAALHWSEQASAMSVRRGLRGDHRLGLKMLTLTLPHSGDIKRDARVLKQAWPRFKRRLQAYLAKDRQSPMLQYWRTREETPGINGDGHVHFHLLLVAPFVHFAGYRLLWARSLPADYQARLPVARIEWSNDQSEVVAIHTPKKRYSVDSVIRRRRLAHALVSRRGPHGRPLTEMSWPVTDIRGAGSAHQSGRAERQGSGSFRDAMKKLVSEAAKYVVKDVEKFDKHGNRTLVDPKVYAAMYCATDGMRRTSCTRTETGAAGAVIRAGWWVIERIQPYVCPCPECGNIGPKKCTIEKVVSQLPRGP